MHSISEAGMTHEQHPAIESAPILAPDWEIRGWRRFQIPASEVLVGPQNDHRNRDGADIPAGIPAAEHHMNSVRINTIHLFCIEIGNGAQVPQSSSIVPPPLLANQGRNAPQRSSPHCNTIGVGSCVQTGGVVSLTSIIAEWVLLLPHSSSAVKVTVAVPV
jgi:hypothetical protein